MTHGLNRKQSGFTLVELLIVIAIIGLLAAALIPVLLASKTRGYNLAAQTCAVALAKAANIYWIDNLSAPNYPAPSALVADVSTFGTQACQEPNLNIQGSAGTSTHFEYQVNHLKGTRRYTVDETKLTTTNL